MQRLVAALVKEGVTLITGRITGVSDPLVVGSDAVIFACGPWLPTLFPELLAEMIVPTKQEVYFFGAPAADTSYAASKLPAWVAFDEGIYSACRIWSIVASRSRSMHTGRRPIPSRSIAP